MSSCRRRFEQQHRRPCEVPNNFRHQLTHDSILGRNVSCLSSVNVTENIYIQMLLYTNQKKNQSNESEKKNETY
jgi:hypothetical protein